MFLGKNSYVFYLYTKSIFISNIKKEKNLKRFKDIKSNIQRNEVAETKGILNYIKSSNVKIDFTLKKVDLKIFVEMSNKTNQFNSNYQRLNIDKVKSYNKDKNSKIITFSVSDKYSDSGIIASLVIDKIKKTYLIIEFLISCRALGRGLEHVFINQIVKKKLSIKNLKLVISKLIEMNLLLNLQNK